MSPIRKLLLHFEDGLDLHVEPDDVRQWLITHGFCDKVTFYYVDTDPNLFNGFFLERHRTVLEVTGVYSEPLICREIFICANQSDEERRLTEVKELLHILDRPDQHSALPDRINSLIEYAATHLSLPHENGAIADAVAEYRAVAILLPWEARAALKPAFDAKRISAGEIADLAKIPEIYVRLVMSARWEEAYPNIIGDEPQDPGEG